MSIKKVANVAGVSIATVSRFFNNPDQVSQKTRQKVQEAIKRLNYSPNTLAQNLRRGKTGLLIAVVPTIGIGSPVYEPILRELQSAAKARGYSLLVKQAELNSLPLAYYQDMVRCKQADGFILLAGLPQEKLIAATSLPIVLACEPPEINHHQLACLMINYKAAAKEATEYLIHLGHKDIGFISTNNDSRTIAALQSGFEEAMENAGLSANKTIAIHESELSSFNETLHKLFSSTSIPTAVFCASDDAALHTLRYAKKRGLNIPKDLSIIGFNNSRYMELTDPPLTTISQPMETIGNNAVDVLCQIIDDEHQTSTIAPMDHRLVVRNSTSRFTR